MVDLRFSSSLQIMMSLGNAARAGDGLMTSTDLADGLHANPALVRKLLGPLAQAGLVETFKGKTGGAKLAKPAKQITLKDIYEASVDKEICSRREDINSACAVGSTMKKIFGAVSMGMEQAMLGHLQETTLQQLISQIK